MTEEEKEKIINAFNNAWNKKIASENSYGKLASKEMFENKEEIILGLQDDGHTVRFNQHLFDQSTIKIYRDEITRLEQERDELKKACEKCKLFDIEKTNRDLLERIDKLEQENKELKEEKQAIKSYLGIEAKTILERLEELDEWKHNDKLLLWKYRSVLEGINRVVKLAHKVEDYLLGQDYTDLVDRIEKEINEVLND